MYNFWGVASPDLILIHHSVGVPEFYEKSALGAGHGAQNQLPIQTFLLPHHEDLINFSLSTLGDRIERNLDFFESFVSLQSFKQSLAPLLCDRRETFQVLSWHWSQQMGSVSLWFPSEVWRPFAILRLRHCLELCTHWTGAFESLR